MWVSEKYCKNSTWAVNPVMDFFHSRAVSITHNLLRFITVSRVTIALPLTSPAVKYPRVCCQWDDPYLYSTWTGPSPASPCIARPVTALIPPRSTSRSPAFVLELQPLGGPYRRALWAAVPMGWAVMCASSRVPSSMPREERQPKTDRETKLLGVLPEKKPFHFSRAMPREELATWACYWSSNWRHTGTVK